MPWNPWNTRAAPALSLALVLALGCVTSTSAIAHSGHATAAAAPPSAVQRTTAAYALPDVPLMGHDGRPVVLSFIYTTCNAICPVGSQVLMQFRERLPEERQRVNMLSVSIDPEQDSPRKLAAYARRFGGAGVWPHYTGTAEDSVAVQRAFDAWRGDKMNHVPLTFLRAAPGQPWVRLEGFVSPDQLVAEYLGLVPRSKD
jgi:protein SCO1